MNLDEIESRLNTIFDDAYYRQIVFWYDENQEFEDVKNGNIAGLK